MGKHTFEWDDNKNVLNILKHGVSFYTAQRAFFDPDRVIADNLRHSSETEKRYYCFGIVDGHILTVRFTYRGENIRIIGAGFWRSGKKVYEKQNKKYEI